MVKEEEPGKSIKKAFEEVEDGIKSLAADTAIAVLSTEEDEEESENEEGANEGGYQGHDLRSGYVKGKARD
jgi:hypothetical protein